MIWYVDTAVTLANFSHMGPNSYIAGLCSLSLFYHQEDIYMYCLNYIYYS